MNAREKENRREKKKVGGPGEGCAVDPRLVYPLLSMFPQKRKPPKRINVLVLCEMAFL